MPSVYTHYLVARETLKSLSSPLQERLRPHLSTYFFGSQGADFCFFYKFTRPKKQNLGSYLHRNGGYDSFCVLREFSPQEDGILAYALGYITHYATDTLFHPHIYAASGKSLLLHSRIEGALDALFAQIYPLKNDGYSVYFRPKLSEEELQSLFLLYCAFNLKTNFPPLNKNSFLRAIRLFNAYLPISFSIFGERKPQLIAKTFGKKEPQKQALALFQNAVDRAKAYIEEFLSAIDSFTPLSRETFAKNYLTGEL